MSKLDRQASFDAARPIRPLSPETVSKLRSSVNITSLSGAISELVQNSIDAQSKNIKVLVNLEKNSCIVEDDGFGIPPNDMKQLGQRYASSKHADRQALATFGFRGEALASIAAHSLLTITSRAHTHRSTGMVRFSYSQAPKFSGSAPEHLRIIGDRTSGTIVRVDGLYGDHAVRMKVRGAMGEFEREREWADITNTLAALMVTRNARGANLTLKDAAASGIKTHRLGIKQHERLPSESQRDSWEVRVLRQIYGEREVGMLDDWEWVKAQKGGISIEGWVCREPSASKRYQFISVNNHPLSNSSYLHSEVNALFLQSRFGMVESLEEDESGKLVSTRKAVEKWVKCVLRITVESSVGHLDVGGEQGTDGKSGIVGEMLSKVSNLLQHLLGQFLRNHHLAPRAPAVKWDKISQFGSSTKRTTTSSKVRIKAPSETTTIKQKPLLQSAINGSTTSATPVGIKGNARPVLLDVAEYSKAKIARYDDREEQGRSLVKPKDTVPRARQQDPPEPIILSDSDEVPENGDKLKKWIDPVTKRSYKVNTRTGNIQVPKAGAAGSTQPERKPGTLTFAQNGVKRIRLDPTPKASKPSPYVKDLLENWKNPVFAAGEALVQQATINHLAANLDPGRDCCHGDDFLEATAQSLTKVSKEALLSAKVIGQVEKKFILVRSLDTDSSNLLLIDQHAASERIRVESFIGAACRIPAPTSPPTKELNFGISQDERTLLERYIRRMQRWGIDYKFLTSATPGKDSEILHIKSLPAAIAERCSNDQRLAIELIRKYLYQLVDASASPEPSLLLDKNTPWVKLLASMPAALLDLLNSKACRGAIMFNDELDMEEMESLVSELACTSFSFQCAHGRPSMVPLGGVAALGPEEDEEEELYPGRFAAWMQREQEAAEAEEEGDGDEQEAQQSDGDLEEVVAEATVTS